jgi:transposase InsO family protein
MRSSLIKTISGTYYLASTFQLKSASARLREQARLLRLPKDALLRLEWMLWHTEHRKNVTYTARHFGISRKTFTLWHTRYQQDNLRSLIAHSHRPHTLRTTTLSGKAEERIVALRKAHLRWGKEKIAVLYGSMYHETVSAWHVLRVIQKYRLYYHPKRNAMTQAKKKRALMKKRIASLTLIKRTGFLFRIDTVVRHFFGTKRYILTAIDSVSRLAFAHMYTTHSSQSAADFLERLRYLTGGRIEHIQTDNGSEFHDRFELALQKHHIPHYWSRTHTPKDNAQNERFNRTLEEEFIQMGNATSDVNLFNHSLTAWLEEYNSVRPHQALGYLSPISFLVHKEGVLPITASDTETA